MSEGKIITFGKKAVTIQNDNKEQFYAPLENLEDLIIPFLHHPYTPLYVSFNINYKKFSGQSNNKKRYFAYNVKLSGVKLSGVKLSGVKLYTCIF